MVHALLGLSDKEALLGHPVAGASWKGLVVENVAAVADGIADLGFYRTSGGAKVDLVLSWPDGTEWAVEVRRSAAPRIERGVRSALSDIDPERSFIVYPGQERFPLGDEPKPNPATAKWHRRGVIAPPNDFGVLLPSPQFRAGPLTLKSRPAERDIDHLFVRISGDPVSRETSER